MAERYGPYVLVGARLGYRSIPDPAMNDPIPRT